MKKIRLIAVLLIAVMLLSGFALAEIITDRSTELYTRPGSHFRSGIFVPANKELTCLDTYFDANGLADWYKVQYAGITGWISAAHAEYIDASPAVSRMELKDYILSDLLDTADELGLEDYMALDSDLKHKYFSDSIILLGNDAVNYIKIKSDAYALHGIYIGMDAQEATDALLEEDMRIFSQSDYVIYFDRPNGTGNNVSYDSCIVLNLDGDTVSSIEWSIYAD